jgi:hypothetical protein
MTRDLREAGVTVDLEAARRLLGYQCGISWSESILRASQTRLLGAHDHGQIKASCFGSAVSRTQKVRSNAVSK